MRIYHPLRLIFDLFDYGCVNFDERENSENIIRFKNLVCSLIKERREEMKNPAYGGYDFMTQLLSDDHYKDND